MSAKDSRIDAYIARSAEFARPILIHLRGIVHAACPQVEETLKWGMPHFQHRGVLCGMAAFKQHCRFMFWKSALVLEDHQGRRMDQFGRITSISDLPPRPVLMGYVRKAVQLNEAGIKVPFRPTAKKKTLVIPPDLRAALKRNRKAQATFDNFSYSHRKEYVEWITEAKREETRTKRLESTIAWLSQGKSRHWKYANC
jgi:uncharacterized protein YdeI (YjbR/CyaY-like superfamily)